MEIKKIEIADFQSHHKTILEPAPAGKLTVIVGPSDSGKTAIIRALRWAFYNTPQGTDFINVKNNTAKVTLTFADGCQAIRERHRKNYNRYNIFDGEKWHTYEGFGNAVPLEVQEVTGIRPVTIGDLELNLNLAEQLDGPFLGKSVSAGARAKVLGKLAGTEEVDYAAKQLNTDLYRRRQEEKNLVAEVAVLEEQIKQFDYLLALAERIETLEKLVAAAKTAQERREALINKKYSLKQVESLVLAAQAAVQRWRHLDLAVNILDQIAADMNRRMVLGQAAARLAEAETVITQSRDALAKLAGVEEAGTAVDAAETAGVRRGRLVSLWKDLDEVQDNWFKTFGIWLKYQDLQEAEKVVEDAARSVERRTSLARAGNLYRQLVAAVKQCRDSLGKLAGVEEAGNFLAGAEALRERQGKVLELAGRLRRVEVENQRARESTVMWEQKTMEFEGAYRDALLSAGRCPVCGSEVKPENLKEVI
ncbi:MAG TPA: AAA family ATPase [Bacillota bacterium]|nr:AAA family ATPase [Bacillota bacterium]